MSRFPGQSQDLINARGAKKISFKGLEKCLEAFTSGEGRVVRKYSRLFSQLSGEHQEDEEEAISWSSSDDEASDAPSQNRSLSRRSKVTRKLNSQINFDCRINAKKNGRRVTSAEFSRSVEHVSQDPLEINTETVPSHQTPNQTSQAQPEDSSSLFNIGILIDQSHNLSIESESSKIVKDLALTPRRESSAADCDVTSPVFKLNLLSTRNAWKGRPKSRSLEKPENDKPDENNQDKIRKLLCLPEPFPSINTNICGNPKEPLLSLTPDNATVDENCSTISPILGRSVSSYHDSVKSPAFNGTETQSLSPVLRKTVRRKRPHNASQLVPASPILEPKKKAFKRKRRRLATFKSSSQSRNDTSLSSYLGISELNESDTYCVEPHTSKYTVKRSLDFTLDKEDHDTSETNARFDDPSETISKSFADHPPPFPNSSHPLGNHSEEQPISFEENLCQDSENILNATNVIEEVNTEELDLSVFPETTRHKKTRLSLRNTCTKSKESTSLVSTPKVIENSLTQVLIGHKTTENSGRIFKVPIATAIRHTAGKAHKRSSEESRIAPTQNSDFLNQTNLIEEVYTEELDLSVLVKPSRGIFKGDERSDNPTFEEILSPCREENELQVDIPDGMSVIDENSQAQIIPCSQVSEKRQTVEIIASKSSKSLTETSEEMHHEFHKYCPTKSTDRELIISQSSTRSGDSTKGNEVGSPEIESVSSQASRGNKDTTGPSAGAVSKSNSTRSPSVSSPLVISSAGSSPGVRSSDQPFVIIEDEYNAPPKRKNKKLDPNGIACRLQRLLNQRRSAARIWQYKRSKLSRLNNKEEKVAEESQGRVLTVFSVRTDYSHIVLFSKENRAEHSSGKEFRGNVLVVLDPGVVLRLGKIMNASKIKIFPPWQSMDLRDRDTTIILGANIVEVISTERDTNVTYEDAGKLTDVKRYTCQCCTMPPPDAIVLECWDGVQSIGLLDILFPLAAPPSTQLKRFDDNTFQTLQLDQSNFKPDQPKYTIKALLSTSSHGKDNLPTRHSRQRSFGLTSKKDVLPHWSIIGRDDSSEVCELILGPVQGAGYENRLNWSDFEVVTSQPLGKKLKFRGVAVSQRLDRSRIYGKWDIVPDQQKIIYILALSNRFSFSDEDILFQRYSWEPEITALANYVNAEINESARNKFTRVSFVCRIFHVNEHTLYVADQSIIPQLYSVLLRPSVFIPPIVLAAVRKPKPTKMLILLQDVGATKGRIVADKYSRLVVLNDNGSAYPEDCCRNDWPASREVCSVLIGIKVFLPQFSPKSRAHNLVKLTGVVCDLDETSALMWPACGSCGSSVDTESENLHFCAQCSEVCKDLIVHMSLIVFVQTSEFPGNVSIRVKILHKTVEALLCTIPKEGQDIMVREALGKPIGPIRCEVTASHGGNFVLNELPSSLWM